VSGEKTEDKKNVGSFVKESVRNEGELMTGVQKDTDPQKPCPTCQYTVISN
jgi:hypothetical protein